MKNLLFAVAALLISLETVAQQAQAPTTGPVPPAGTKKEHRKKDRTSALGAASPAGAGATQPESGAVDAGRSRNEANAHAAPAAAGAPSASAPARSLPTHRITTPAASADAAARSGSAASVTSPASTASRPMSDAVDGSLKGPQGQPVFTGPRNGKYYINKNGKKTYLPKAK